MRTSKKLSLVFPSLLLVSLVFFPGSKPLRAQVTASLSGTIQDASGAGVPQAIVTVTSVETGAGRMVIADSEGYYRVLSLPVGRYQMKAEKIGFKTAIHADFDLVVGQQGAVNLNLEVGRLQQEVTVTAETRLVNGTTASVSGLVGEKEVKDLPLNGRSFDNLIALTTGAYAVTSLKHGGASGQLGNLFSISGRRYGENLFLFDGVEYMGPSQGHSVPGGVSGELLGIDAVREFNVVTDTYGAEYGKRAGGQISIVSMSGTNQLHGALYEFVRNSALDARNFFDHPQGERIPPFQRNQFGVALGGPIWRDHTFLFGNYEGFRQQLGVSSVSIVPDANARLGLLPCGVITPLPLGCHGTSDTAPAMVPNLNSGMLPYANIWWPVPNGPNLGGGAAEAFYNPLQTIREDFGLLRVDQLFSRNDFVGGSYLVDDGYNQSPQANPNWGQNTDIRNQVLSLQETHIFSPDVVNVLTAGFSRATFLFVTPALVPVPPDLVFITGQLNGRLSIGGSTLQSGGGFTTGGSTVASDQTAFRNAFSYGDTLQIIRGRHQISAGVWFEQLQSNEHAPKEQAGVAVFSTLTTFLQGITSNFQAAPVSTELHWRQLEGAWYVQDTIQLRRNLSLRFGLRHEFDNGWTEAGGEASNYYFTNGTFQTHPTVGSSVFAKNNAKWLFGPRLGMAWDPFGNGNTSIHAGFGVHFDLNDTLGIVLDSIAPYNGIETFRNAPFLPLIPINPATPLPAACGPGIPIPCTLYSPGGIAQNAKTPTIEEWNLTVEQEITPNMSLRVSYVGSHGYHMLIAADPNSIVPQICADDAGCVSGGVGAARGLVAEGLQYIPVGTLPNPYLAGVTSTNWIGSFGVSSYNALNVAVTRRFHSGLQFKANYTWAKAEDTADGYAADGGAGVPQSFWLNNQSTFGVSGINQKNQFVFSGGYEFPFGKNKPFLNGASGVWDKVVTGWQVNSIVTLLSGFPFGPLTGSNRSGDGNTANPDRPNWNPAFIGPVIEGTPNQWFNPNAFSLEAAGTFGNVGKNVLVGPNFRGVDVSIFKTTSVSERVRLEFRAEAFNVLNRANFNLPGSFNVFSGTTISPAAGVILTTANSSRQLQLGLKFIY
jgi:carboxypeptidase family protein